MITESRTISVSVNCPVREVYEFASNPENLPQWASGLSQGPVKVKFTELNPFGVLDHYITLPQGVEIYVPMRVVANGLGSEVSLTLFRQPDMSKEKFAEDANWVKRDLTTLKKLLEK